MTDKDFEKITPAELELGPRKASPEIQPEASATPQLGAEEVRRREAWQTRNTRILWGIFGVLLFLAGGVVFVLPDLVPTGATSPAAVSQTPQQPAAAPRLPGPAVSPYQEAQLMQQREAAQASLARLLELQDALEVKDVQAWAQEDFDSAVAFARTGDEAYRQQQFLQADEQYRQGVALLEDLQARAPEVFAAQMERGAQAILDGRAQAARDAYSLALAIDPASREAEAGMGRAEVLDQVLALLDQGTALHEGGQLEQARERYQQALAVDAGHRGAAQALEQVRQDILDRDFSNLMSRGYAALQSGSPEQAEESFKQALALKPNSADAQAAIEQAGDQITTNAVNRHLAQAADHEKAEQWQAALEAYQEAQAIDPNVVAVTEGLERARNRLNLDNFLENLVDNPLRLAEDAILQQARQVYAAASRLGDPGPRLRGQLEETARLLAMAREPVPVSLVSDGLTRVTVYRVGELGQFTNHTLSLPPGTYTAVGIREGYRDVRKEFVVAFDGQPPVVDIACDEQVL